MKYLLTTQTKLSEEGRWDADYHLPPVGIGNFHVDFDNLSDQALCSYAGILGLSISADTARENIISSLKRTKPNYHELSDERLESILSIHEVDVPSDRSMLLSTVKSLALCSISDVADIVNDKRNPSEVSGNGQDPMFTYTSISDVDVITGEITNPQRVFREEAPSRARQVAKCGDIIISTTRPTRGCIAVVPNELDDTIFSTGFCIIRPKIGVDSHTVKFLLRLPSTLEQFRKWSAGVRLPCDSSNERDEDSDPEICHEFTRRNLHEFKKSYRIAKSDNQKGI